MFFAGDRGPHGIPVHVLVCFCGTSQQNERAQDAVAFENHAVYADMAFMCAILPVNHAIFNVVYATNVALFPFARSWDDGLRGPDVPSFQSTPALD